MKFGVTPGGGGNAPIWGGVELALMTLEIYTGNQVCSDWRIKFHLEQHEGTIEDGP